MINRPDSDDPKLPESDPAEPPDAADPDPSDETTHSDYVDSPDEDVDRDLIPDDEEDIEEEEPRRGGLSTVLTVLLVLALVVLVAFVLRGIWAPAAKDLADRYAPFLSGPLAALTAPSKEMAALGERVEALETLSRTAEEQGRSIATLEYERAALREKLSLSIERINELDTMLAEMRGIVNALTAPDGELSAARDALDDLESRVDALERTPGDQAVRRELGKLRRQMADMAAAGGDPAVTDEVRETTRELSAANADLREKLAALTGRLETLAAETAVTPAEADATLSLVIALNELRDAARGSEPFAEPLARVRDLADEAAGLTEPLGRLAAEAESGVPSIDRLRARFDDLASGVDVAMTGENDTLFGLEEGGWVDQTLSRLLSVVTVRRTDTPPAPGEIAVGALRDARAALAAGDLATAATGLRDLEGGLAERFAPWLADADRRIAVDAAADAIQDQAVALLEQSHRE